MAIANLGLLGSGSATSAGTTLVITNTTGAVIPAGTLIHITGTWDNINSVTAPTITSSTVGGVAPTANHATAVGQGVTTTAGVGVWHQCFRVLTTGTIASGATIATLTSNQSAVKRVGHAQGFSGATSTLRGTVATGVHATGSPSVATAGTALVTGDVVIGSVSNENNAQMTADADTLNGSWSTIVGLATTGGAANTNVNSGSQAKIVTATGVQTFNPTGGVLDTVACVYSLQPVPDPAVTQAAYRWYDEGTESGAVALGNQDTAVVGDINNGDATGTLRIRLQSTTAVAVPTTDDWQLQYEKNLSGTWVNVTASSLAAATYDSPNLTNQAATTNRLTGGTGTFVAGKISEDSLMDDLGWAGNNYTELVYALKIKAADVVNGDTLRFRVLRNGSTATLTYTQTPRINIVQSVQATASLTATSTLGATAAVLPPVQAAVDFVATSTLSATAAAGAPSAEIEFVGTGTPVVQAVSNATVTSNLPAGWAVDDLLLFAIHHWDVDTVLTPPTGWTLAPDGRIEDGVSMASDIYYKFAQAGETAPTATMNDLTRYVSQVVAYRNVDQTSPFIDTSGAPETGSGISTHSAPALTNDDAAAWGVFTMSVKIATPASSSAGSGLTERLDNNLGSATGNLVAHWSDTNGTIGTGSHTFSGGSNANSALAVMWGAILRPDTSTAPAYGPDESMYPADVFPGFPGAAQTFMLGSRFQVTAAGRITAIRYRPGNVAYANRYVALWRDDGTLLHGQRWTGETTGWNVLTLPAPVDVTAGETFRVAIGYPGSAAYAGGYANATTGSYTVGSSHLTWIDGVYSNFIASGGDDDFPANVFSQLYFADVIYQPGDAPPATTTGQITMAQVSRVRDTYLRGAWMTIPGADVRMVVSTSSDLSSPTYSSVVTVPASGWVTAKVTGLTADTQHHVGLEIDGTLQTDYRTQGKTLPTPGTQTNFTILAGSCQETGSNHSVFSQMATESAAYTIHMGDLHYADAADVAAWRTGVESSLQTGNMKALMAAMPMPWLWDNHDSPGGGNHSGHAAWPSVASAYRELAGTDMPDSRAGYDTWVHGRVRFVWTDHWAWKDSSNDPETVDKSMLGETQKQWWKDTLTAATEPLIVWIATWPTTELTTRWGGFTTETAELEAWLNARPAVKSRLVMIGGDSHDVRATSGTRDDSYTNGTAFIGVPSLNASPFDKVPGGGTNRDGWDIGAFGGTTTLMHYARLDFADFGGSNGVELAWTARRSDDVDALTWTHVFGAAAGEIAGSVALTATSTLSVAAVREPQAAASLVSTSTLSATAVRQQPATAALAAVSTLSATVVRIPQAAASLVATSTLTATTVRQQPATVALTAASTLTAAGFEQAVGAISLTATSTLTATAITVGFQQASANLTAVSTLSATAAREPQAAASLVAASTLGATATRQQPADAALSAASTLGATAVREPQAAVSLVAASTLTAGAVVTEFASAAFSAVSTLATTGDVRAAIFAAAVLTAISTLTATPVRQPQAAASLTAGSTLTATAVRDVPATASLSAVSTLIATGVRAPQAAASLVGASTLTTTGLRTVHATAGLTASATLTVGGVTTGAAAAAMVATSTLTATSVRTPQAAASLTATSTVTATGLRTAQLTAVLTATSTLTSTAVGVGVLSATASLTAASTLAATAVRQPQATASLVAASALTVSAVRAAPATASLTAASTLTATSVREPQAAVSLTAASTLTTTSLRTQHAAVALSATSTLTSQAAGFGITQATAALTAVSTLTTGGVRVAPAAAPLAAVSTLTATAVRQPQATASLVAASTLTTTALRTTHPVAALSAVSTLSATAAGIGVTQATATLTATSTLTTSAVRAPQAAASLTASSTLTATAVRIRLTTTGLTATSTLSATAVRQPAAAASLSATSTLTVVGVRQLQTMATLTATSTLGAMAVTILPIVGLSNVARDGTLQAKDINGGWYPVQAIP